MTNTNIIFNAALAHGFTEEELVYMIEQHRGDLPFHTAADWSRRGYQIKKDAAALFDCYLWKHTNKPSRATIQAAQENGDDIPEQSPHFYQKLSYIYGPAQVERTPTAPDLATLKARLDTLPGLAYKVKGEKTGSPNVWITAGADAHAETIKALGGIWSKKKAAYWIKPSTSPATAEDRPAAPVPSMMEDAPAVVIQDRPAFALPPVRLALPAPAKLLALPAHVEEPAPEPVPDATPARTPCPWKKCSFYTIRRDEKTKRPTAQQVDGYTDGVYNYYATGEKSKQWHAIHPVYGLSVAYASSRKAAQEQAQERAEQVQRIESNPDARLKHYAAMIKTAQDGGNVTLAGF